MAQREQNDDVWYCNERALVRRLRVEDVGEAYASWFEDDAVRAFIKFARCAPTVAELRAYCREKSEDPNVEFLGVFDAQSGRHLGNVKFEQGPRPGEAHVGFLIGSVADRRRGLLRDVLPSCIARLRRERGAIAVYLTVDPTNAAGLSAFTRLGFRDGGQREPNGDLRMDYAG